MVKSELIEKLRGDCPELTASEIERLVNALFAAVVDQLDSGGRVEIRGFGIFSSRVRDARRGRNPRTGAETPVPSKRVIHFRPGKEMRGRLNPKPS